MAELETGKPVSLEELKIANLAQTDALTEVLIETRHGRGVKAEAAGEACGLSAHSKAHGAVTTEHKTALRW